MENNLQIAVAKMIENKLNVAYRELTSDDNNLFKCSTIFDFDYSEFKQYDDDGNLIVNQYNSSVRYIPVFVESIIGDREPIPNCFVSEVSIPLSMSITLDNINIALSTIAQFTNNCLGQVYDLDYQELGLPFKIAFVPNLPDCSDFDIVQGQENKICDLTLSAVISSNLNYGNQIEYELSCNNGSTYEKIVKIDPSTTRAYALYQDQLVNGKSTKALVQTETWNKSFSMYGYHNSDIAKLLMYITDNGEDEFVNTLYPNGLNWKFRTTYNSFGLNNNIVFKDILPNIEETIEFNIEFEIDEIVYEYIKIEKNISTQTTNIFISQTDEDSSFVVYGRNIGETSDHWFDNKYKTLKLTPNTNKETLEELLEFINANNLGTLIDTPIQTTKDVLVTDLSYSDALGDFISLNFSLVEKL